MERNRYPVSEEQKAEAKKLDLLTYLQRYEPNELVHIHGNEYCTRTHDSLKITLKKDNESIWNWYSQGFGGKTALDYLIKVQGYTFVDAVKKLCGLSYVVPAASGNPPTKAKEKRPFILPSANFTNNVITNYLCKERGLSKSLVDECIRRKLIYEAKEHHNIVFVGYDIKGTAQFATMRGCYGKQFRHDVEGSNKAYSFSVSARKQEADILCVFESAIDALSFLVLSNVCECSDMLALSGVAPPKSSNRTMQKIPVALEQYLTDHPQIKHVILCLDNDDAGRKATKEISRLVEARGYVVSDMPPKLGKDYNEELLARRELQREKDQCR